MATEKMNSGRVKVTHRAVKKNVGGTDILAGKLTKSMYRTPIRERTASVRASVAFTYERLYGRMIAIKRLTLPKRRIQNKRTNINKHTRQHCSHETDNLRRN